MMFLSPLGLGARLIGSRRPRRRPQRHSGRCVKAVSSPGKFDVSPKTFGSRFELKRKRKQLEEETWVKKSRGNACCNQKELNVISNTFSNSSIFNEDVVREILSRLPVKSLMRFKCVCKYWLYLIQEDLSFSDQHLEHSKTRPGLLITNLTDRTGTLMTADLVYEGKDGAISTAAVHTIREIDGTYYDRRLGPVNGLIGFYGKTIPPGVCICNLSTREVTPWIESKSFSELSKKSRKPLHFPLASLALGYDPATKEHKVVGIWSYDRPKKVVCEVLTVGDNEWRKIDEVPPFTLDYWAFSSSVYVNGSIYYTTLMLMACEPSAQDEPKFIVAFNVRSEKFRTIRVPNEIFDRPAAGANFCISHSVKLYELDGRLAVLVKLLNNGFTSKLWLFDDDDNKDASSAWTEIHLELPYTLGGSRHGFFHPVSRADQTIVTSCIQSFPDEMPDVTCHSYNWKNKSFNEIQITGIPSSVPGFSCDSRVATFAESLLPVQKQTTSGSRRKFITTFQERCVPAI